MTDKPDPKPNVSTPVQPVQPAVPTAPPSQPESALPDRPALTQDMNPNTAVKHWLSSLLPTSQDKLPPEKK